MYKIKKGAKTNYKTSKIERKTYLRPIKELVLLLTDTADPDQQ